MSYYEKRAAEEANERRTAEEGDVMTPPALGEPYVSPGGALDSDNDGLLDFEDKTPFGYRQLKNGSIMLDEHIQPSQQRFGPPGSVAPENLPQGLQGLDPEVDLFNLAAPPAETTAPSSPTGPLSPWSSNLADYERRALAGMPNIEDMSPEEFRSYMDSLPEPTPDYLQMAGLPSGLGRRTSSTPIADARSERAQRIADVLNPQEQTPIVQGAGEIGAGTPAPAARDQGAAAGMVQNAIDRIHPGKTLATLNEGQLTVLLREPIRALGGDEGRALIAARLAEFQG